MNEVARVDKAFETACRQVGQFLYNFSLLERELDDGIGKLFGIEAGAVDIVTANMDVARKMNVLCSAEVFKAEMPDEVRKKLLVETFSAIWSLNDKRKVVAHCPFSPGEQSGVVFRRAVASKRLHVKDEEWTDLQFQTAFAEADKTRANLGRIIAEMVPYTAAADFSDPRNSGYIAVVL